MVVFRCHRKVYKRDILSALIRGGVAVVAKLMPRPVKCGSRTDRVRPGLVSCCAEGEVAGSLAHLPGTLRRPWSLHELKTVGGTRGCVGNAWDANSGSQAVRLTGWFGFFPTRVRMVAFPRGLRLTNSLVGLPQLWGGDEAIFPPSLSWHVEPYGRVLRPALYAEKERGGVTAFPGVSATVRVGALLAPSWWVLVLRPFRRWGTGSTRGSAGRGRGMVSRGCWPFCACAPVFWIMALYSC